ncbi:hypothetical protein GLYMA_09G188051v4 [Glycine max]|nr:hypothetical protein GLYMA_09G188051v4 [Glycine max]KAH1043677.1 hypothetical protein GYH30_025499 [Glycine max]
MAPLSCAKLLLSFSLTRRAILLQCWILSNGFRRQVPCQGYVFLLLF